ncbi:TFIIB-type zinc ribbon-containing protein [Neorhodopirellula lusitana]|uniref:TFIIB-type zinc ribbon-containing protein n=1 Tax=Neorhodopirellula lusitana TaxID=445327 RepID=UPI00384ABCC1
MKCISCAAPVSRLDRSGRYVCDYCETEAVAKALSDSIDKLVLTGTASSLACPSCCQAGSKNGNTVMLETGSLDNQSILGCRTCQGVWIRRPSFALLVHGRRSEYTGPDRVSDFDLAVDGPRSHYDRLECPTCQSTMESFFYAGPGRVAIDSCAACERVWLDCGELTRIAEAPGRR